MWNKIKLMMSDGWTWIEPILIILATQAGKALMASAVAAVKNAATEQGFSNSQKRDAAYQMIRADMKSAGWTIGESVVNTAIELALQKMKQGK